jgi:cellulose biosynthesis protein BcsQ
MSKNTDAVTPLTVAAKAAADGVVIPTQAEEKPAEVTEAKTGEQVVDEKNSEGNTDPRFKARLASLTNLLKENRRVIVGLGAAAVVAGVAFAKYAKKKVEEEILEAVEVEPNTVTGDHSTDESAA